MRACVRVCHVVLSSLVGSQGGRAVKYFHDRSHALMSKDGMCHGAAGELGSWTQKVARVEKIKK